MRSQSIKILLLLRTLKWEELTLLFLFTVAGYSIALLIVLKAIELNKYFICHVSTQKADRLK